ncbi:hypothetical protein RZ517_14510 [Roseovarius sp. S88]|uniref:Uncharacterized protein n=1 Tax=Roseovarius phycicola TaxID=3080976 RepID=A0ABZ2HJ75_9RHOB
MSALPLRHEMVIPLQFRQDLGGIKAIFAFVNFFRIGFIKVLKIKDKKIHIVESFLAPAAFRRILATSVVAGFCTMLARTCD